MLSLQTSSSQSDFTAHGLRRSDRKRTKRIMKDDFLLPNPFKVKSKRHRSLRLPQNLDSQMRKIQFLTQRTLEMLNYGKQEFNVGMLNQMKQAVSQQQLRLSEMFAIKLIGEVNSQQNIIPSNLQKNQPVPIETLNTLKIQENTQEGDYFNEIDSQKDILRKTTSDEMYSQFYLIKMDQQDNMQVFNDEISLEIEEIPRMHKENSRLLSDNYENNELLYTMEHMMPIWHKQEIEFHQEYDYLD